MNLNFENFEKVEINLKQNIIDFVSLIQAILKLAVTLQ